MGNSNFVERRIDDMEHPERLQGFIPCPARGVGSGERTFRQTGIQMVDYFCPQET
jgi:hypothetical protein